MKKQAIVVLALTLGACGGSIDGNYVGGPGNAISIDIQGDNATAAMGPESKTGTVIKGDKKVAITIEKQTKEFKIDDKGCLVEAEMGTFCKK